MLIANNCTTYEHFRHRYSDAGNPYNNGMLNNFKGVLCTAPLPRHTVPLWDKQREEDAVAGRLTHLTMPPGTGSIPPSIDGASSIGTAEGMSPTERLTVQIGAFGGTSTASGGGSGFNNGTGGDSVWWGEVGGGHLVGREHSRNSLSQRDSREMERDTSPHVDEGGGVGGDAVGSYPLPSTPTKDSAEGDSRSGLMSPRPSKYM